MGTLGSLAVSIIGDNQLSDTFDDVKKKTQDFGGSVQDVGKNVGNVGKGMTKWVTGPIAAVGAGALGLAKKWAATGDEIAKTSTKLGISTDALQEMDYWAGQNGLSSQAMERAVGRLNQRVGRAAEGNEKYAEAFENVGVAVRDSEGNIRDTEDVMRDTIGALQDIEEPALRSAMASEIFGTKMARDLMPALEDGSLSMEEAAEKAHELGIVMDEESLKAAEDFEDAWDDASRSIMGVVHSVGAELLPILVDQVIPAFQEHIVPAIRDLGERIGDIIKWFADLDPFWQKIIIGAIGVAAALGPVLVVVGKVISIVGTLITVFGALTGPIGLVIAAVVAVVAIFWYLWNNWDEVKDLVGGAIDALVGFFSELPGRVMAFLTDTWKNMQAWGSNMVDSARSSANQVVSTVVSFLSKLPGRLLQIGRNMITSFAKGIRDRIGNVTGAIGEVASTIRGWLPFSPAKEGPLRQLPDFSSYLVDPAKDAVRDMKGMLRRDMDEVGDLVPGRINHVLRDGTINVGGRVDVHLSGEGARYLNEKQVSDAVTAKITDEIDRGDRRVSNRARLIPG